MPWNIEDQGGLPGVAQNGLNTKKSVDFSTKLGIKSLTSTELTTVYTTAKFTVGTRGRDASGNEYIFLAGVASVAAGTWVSFDELYVTTLLTTTSVGSAAVALAANVASTWGWFQIYGKASGKIGNAVADNAQLFISSVTGSVDDLVVTGDIIYGAISRGASSVTGANIDVQLNYPFTTQTAGSY